MRTAGTLGVHAAGMLGAGASVSRAGMLPYHRAHLPSPRLRAVNRKEHSRVVAEDRAKARGYAAPTRLVGREGDAPAEKSARARDHT